ncbi:tripartite tricarboxylate transporter TctB family protein [Nocardioides zhouii]|uniref:Tripartite tricarboxylate transporter TctB family protein n=1 Tax=Nocardioides zhouii TaxID=1168729 RepID=A0A4Q2T2P0_9ACTN|nr:tripartite tricarboxylate transporter TctB family protein [Nocardioides zhouii]RYC11260.1 tripartite tricarboxylate transporter TctB family protein [Nocardioides zhouii]
MTEQNQQPEATTATRPFVDTAQYGMAALLAVAGSYIVFNGTQMRTSASKDFLPPSTFAYVVGAALLVLSVLLAIATARGDTPDAADGEDVDLSSGSDVRTLVLLVAVLCVNVFLIEPLGWPVTGAILFTGAAWVLGSRHWVRDIAIGVALSFGTFYAFYLGLGVPLPVGILNGAL